MGIGAGIVTEHFNGIGAVLNYLREHDSESFFVLARRSEA